MEAEEGSFSGNISYLILRSERFYTKVILLLSKEDTFNTLISVFVKCEPKLSQIKEPKT